MRPSNIATLLWPSLLLLGNWRFQNIGSANHVDNGFHPMFGVNRAFLVEGSVDIISVLENIILFLAF